MLSLNLKVRSARLLLLVPEMLRQSDDQAAGILLAHHDPKYAAEAVDLAHVSSDSPGISRRKFGKGFAYYQPNGKKIAKKAEIERLNRLAIPPAYKDVWICPDPTGHLQAVGVDDRGRKQYRYHERWGEVRNRAKFSKLAEFAKVLPKLRRTTNRHLRLDGLPREKVLAACVKLLDKLYLRVGNADYAESNGSYGLTTLQDDHATFDGGVVRLEFTAKHGIERDVKLRDSRLARVIEASQALEGDELLQYLDDAGNVRDIGSVDVNDYLHQFAGASFSAKDFRTWHATVLAVNALRDEVPAASKTAMNKQVVAAIDDVAGALGNTRAVCRKCYVDPRVTDAFEAGNLTDRLAKAKPVRGLSKSEWQALALLE